MNDNTKNYSYMWRGDDGKSTKSVSNVVKIVEHYGSRTLTPSSQDRRPNSQSQLYQTMNQNVNIPYDIRSQSTQGEISDYYTHPRLPTYREYETRSLSAYSQTHPQSHITSFGSEQYLTREPMQRTSSLVASPARSESVSTKRNVTTFSPMTGVDRDPGVPLAPSVATTITNTTTTNMSSTPTIVTRHSRVRSSSPLRAQNAYAHQYNPRMEYGSGISHRQNFSGHHRRAISPPALSHRNIRTIQSETSSMSSGLFSPYGGSTAASIIRDAREREKKEMSELNDRLASYIEKVRFLEAQNRKLAADLDFLRNRWGRDTSSIRGMYEVDIKQAQKLIEDTENQREELLKTIYKLEEERSILQRKFEDAEKARYGDREEIDEALMKLSALEAEIALIKRRNGLIEEEIAHAKRENHRLLNDLQHARNDLDQQTLNRIDYQNQVQTLIEEIDFLRRAHDGEIHDLQAMASRDTTSENREYFRNELSSAIRDIRSEYDKVCNVQRVDMESWYKLKVQEIQTQSNRQNMEQNYVKEELRRLRVQMGELRSKSADLEGRNAMLEKQAEELNYQLEDEQRSYESALNDRDSQIRKIREECQMLMVELQMLLDTKQSLDAEIVIYHKTLEGEEDRAGLRQLVEQVPRTHHYKQSDESGIETTRLLRGETSSRQSYQRSAKGNVAIREVAHDGRFVVIENTHRSRAENISEWRFRRRIDNDKHEIHFTFPHGFILGPAKSVKIWARNQGPFNPPDELVFDAEESFGVGNNVQNFLYNAQGEERASLIQRSSH